MTVTAVTYTKTPPLQDIAVLQKYIASMREQSEKGMEKVREFIAKEKTRNEATTRKLINEHEKILCNHKKELNKIVYSIHRLVGVVAGRVHTRSCHDENWSIVAGACFPNPYPSA